VSAGISSLSAQANGSLLAIIIKVVSLMKVDFLTVDFAKSRSSKN
jgi:hypothetical protein